MTTLSRSTVAWAIEHLARHYDTDIFPKAFEFQALSHCRDDIESSLSTKDICQWQTRPFRKCLVPKGRFGFRIATQLDPLDILFYISIILEIADRIEAARIPPDQHISFSSRYLRDDDAYLLFDRSIGYPEFQQHSLDLSRQHPYVVLTDIADFYPRIYLHRLENELSSAVTTLPSHVKAICRLIKSWNHNVSFGIPIGNNPSRLLAELVIDDVDRSLLSDGVTFCRYVDDYRIFCNSREDAYRCLSNLARLLYETHGLTLQAQKTRILTSEEFMQEIIHSEERRALDSLSERFREILSQVGISDPYRLIEYGDLPEDLREEINALNLVELLSETISHDEFDLSMARFIINRLGWLRNQDALDVILANIDVLHPIFSEVIKYFARLTDDFPEDVRAQIGSRLLDLLDGSVVSQLEFHRTLIMGLFADSNKWRNEDRLPGYYMLARDDWMRRSVLLGIGKASQDYWLRARKSHCEQMPPWERRAFLYAASCLPADERRHWYRAIRSRLDDLDQYVIEWAKANPIDK